MHGESGRGVREAIVINRKQKPFAAFDRNFIIILIVSVLLSV